MKIGLLSDTHSFLDERVFHHFREVDEIWHAGDIGERIVLDRLEAFKPTRAVFGNIDDRSLQSSLPEDWWHEVNGVSVWMTHIGGAPPNYNPRIKKVLRERVPMLFICGHSHILRVARDPAYQQMIYLNPGAAGNHGFHTMKTIMRFSVEGGEVKNLEVIELGKRGALPAGA